MHPYDPPDPIPSHQPITPPKGRKKEITILIILILAIPITFIGVPFIPGIGEFEAWLRESYPMPEEIRGNRVLMLIWLVEETLDLIFDTIKAGFTTLADIF